MKICKMCSKEITAERRKAYCCNECYIKAKIESRKDRKQNKVSERSKAIIKKSSVCTGCIYRSKFDSYSCFCNYLGIVGKSRVIVERENGGVKADSCICYKARKERNVTSSRYTEDRRAY